MMSSTSPITRLQSIFPGFSPTATSRTIVNETPQDRAARLLAEARANIERSRARPAPSTSERVPSNYHAGIAGKIWFLPYMDSVTKDSPEIRQAMRLMRRDGYVKAAWEPQVLTVCSEDWQIQASEPGNSESEEQGDAFRAMIEGIAGGMPQLVRSVVAALGSDGHSIAEKVWGVAERGRLEGKIVCTATKPKDTQEGTGVVRLEGDQFGNVQWVQALRKGGERFPITDFLYSRYLTVFDEPLGEAAYRPAYGAYWMRDTVRKLRAIHCEKKMAGMLVGEYENDDDKGPLETALQKAKTSTWMTVPAGTRVHAEQLSTATEPDYKSFDESLRDEIVTSIAFATLQIIMGNVPGEGRGDSKVQKATADLGPWLLMAIVMDVINTQLAPDFIDFNYPYAAGGGYPKLTFGAVSNSELLELIEVVQGAQAIGLKPSKKHYAAALSIKEADPNDPTDQMAPISTPMPTAQPPRDQSAPVFVEKFGDRTALPRMTEVEIKAALQRFAKGLAA